MGTHSGGVHCHCGLALRLKSSTRGRSSGATHQFFYGSRSACFICMYLHDLSAGRGVHRRASRFHRRRGEAGARHRADAQGARMQRGCALRGRWEWSKGGAHGEAPAHEGRPGGRHGRSCRACMRGGSPDLCGAGGRLPGLEAERENGQRGHEASSPRQGPAKKGLPPRRRPWPRAPSCTSCGCRVRGWRCAPCPHKADAPGCARAAGCGCRPAAGLRCGA